jgi:hypothetical protein
VPLAVGRHLNPLCGFGSLEEGRRGAPVRCRREVACLAIEYAQDKSAARDFALYLHFTEAISFERLSHLLSDLLGVDFSEGALVNMFDDNRPAFIRQASLIRAKLLTGTILASDETAMRVGKQNWWAWVFHHADSACFVVHPNRSRAAVKEFLGNWRPDSNVSWAAGLARPGEKLMGNSCRG